MMSDYLIEYQINILVTEQGVSMGDHGQDIVRAVTVDDAMTLRELVSRTLTRRQWDESREAMPDAYLTIRLAMPAEQLEDRVK